MLLGFISLLLNVVQGGMQKICVDESVMHHLLPCPLPPAPTTKDAKAVEHYGATAFAGDVLGSTRRLLAGGGKNSDYCFNKVLRFNSLRRTGFA
jgi:mlo protein